MSYDIHLEIAVETGGPESQVVCCADVGNYTSNVSGMWKRALGYSLADMKDKPAGAHIRDLQRAVTAMEAAPGIYRAMNPPNSWGSYDGALAYLRRLRDACIAHPKATIRISH